MQRLLKFLTTVIPWLGWVLALLTFLQRNPPPRSPQSPVVEVTTDAVLPSR